MITSEHELMITSEHEWTKVNTSGNSKWKNMKKRKLGEQGKYKKVRN